MWNANEPYNDLPPLPPAAALETTPVLKLVIEARAALASLDQAARRLPNSRVLLNALPILEAQASSEIENIVTTTDDMFRFSEDETSTDPATREALRYRAALYEGFASVQARTLNVSTAIDVCSRIKMRDMSIRRNPGTFIGNPVTQEAIYTPPVGEQTIRTKLANWESFIHSGTDLDPLITMAVTHYQFEAIHPFEDGNGRTGRILNVLVLVNAMLLSQPILYLSRYIIQHKSDYYRLLQRVTAEGAWEEWVLFILEAVRTTSIDALQKIDAIAALQESMQDQVRSVLGSVNADLLHVLFEQPYCRIKTVVENCHVSRPTASGWLKSLSDAGVLVEVRAGREKLFVNRQFLATLTTNASSDRSPTDPMLF